MRLDEGVLGGLLGVGRRAGDHPGRAERDRLVPSHDLLVGVELAAPWPARRAPPRGVAVPPPCPSYNPGGGAAPPWGPAPGLGSPRRPPPRRPPPPPPPAAPRACPRGRAPRGVPPPPPRAPPLHSPGSPPSGRPHLGRRGASSSASSGRNGSRQEHAAQVPRRHLRDRRGRDLGGRPAVALHRAGRGLQPRPAARDNVIINAIMLGLSPREARERFDEVIDFAELEEFVDLKLKNYSSGMSVRLGVLGDDPGRRRRPAGRRGARGRRRRLPAEVLRRVQRMRDEGRTILFVTHDMAPCERFCDRAMLLERGGRRAIGARRGRRPLHRAQLRASGGARRREGRTAPATAPRIGSSTLDRGRARRARRAVAQGRRAAHACVEFERADRGPVLRDVRAERRQTRLRGQRGRPAERRALRRRRDVDFALRSRTRSRRPLRLLARGRRIRGGGRRRPPRTIFAFVVAAASAPRAGSSTSPRRAASRRARRAGGAAMSAGRPRGRPMKGRRRSAATCAAS